MRISTFSEYILVDFEGILLQSGHLVSKASDIIYNFPNQYVLAILLKVLPSNFAPILLFQKWFGVIRHHCTPFHSYFYHIPGPLTPPPLYS